MSDSVWPQRQQPTRLPCTWDSPGKNIGVGCYFLLQCMKVKSESEVAQSCPTLATPCTAAYQVPLSMGFSKQKYWSGCHCFSICCTSYVQRPGLSIQWGSGRWAKNRHMYRSWLPSTISPPLQAVPYPTSFFLNHCPYITTCSLASTIFHLLIIFQMFKLVLEKAEEPEIKLPTSTGS